MKFKKVVNQLVVAGILTTPLVAFANDSAELEALRGLVQQLEQKVKVLERKSEITDEEIVAAKKSTPIVKASNSGFGLESADGKNAIRLKGLLQADYRAFANGANDVRNRTNNRAGNLDDEGFHDAPDTGLLRRVRPTIEGTLNGKYDFRFTPEFAGGSASVVDAYIDAKLDPAFKIRAGKYKPFVGLERLQSGADIKFLERSYVTNAILPNRDVGVSLYGDVLGDKLSYAVGINNGVVDGGNASGASEFDGSKELTWRLFTSPFKDDVSALSGLGFGVAGTATNIDGERNLDFTNTSAADATRNGLPSYLTEGQQTFFRYGSAVVADGKRTRIAPQAYYYNGPWGIIAEYARVNQEVSLLNSTTSNTASVFVGGSSQKLKHDAWDVAVSYLLTGEDSSFKGVKPKRDFDLSKGGWGAWELVARYSEINLDKDTFKRADGSGQYGSEGSALTSAYADLTKSARAAHTWTAGVNWYLNQNAKIQLNYEHTSFDGGALKNGLALTTNNNATGSNVRDREDEDALLARLQVAF